MKSLTKDLRAFPPFLTLGNSLTQQIRRLYLAQTETISALIVVVIFANFILFCGDQNSNNGVFRIINTSTTILITVDLVLKVTLIRVLYLNPFYYGIGFALLDLLSGPIALGVIIVSYKFNISNIYLQTKITITVADILLLLRIFCLERIRLLIRDVFYILWVSRYINYALLLTYYVYSYIAYALFREISPKYFRNIFKTMLSMFQVLTLDSWNLQVNQSVSQSQGQIWSVFFLFFILFMFFYFINLLLGAFVSYYSNPHLRRHFEYDYAHDTKLNPEMAAEKRLSMDIRAALKVLELDQQEYEKKRSEWTLGYHEKIVYLYVTMQIIFEILILIIPGSKYAYFIVEECFGIWIMSILIQKYYEYRQFRGKRGGIEERTIEEIEVQFEEGRVRLYILILLFFCGPVAIFSDVYSLVITLQLRFGPAFRLLIVLCIGYVQKLIFKFVEVLPGVSHIIIFIAGLLFTLAVIGHQFLSNIDVGYPLFASLTDTYLFMLQVITFDSWGDVARIVISKNGTVFVIYFLFLTLFIGFFLMNMLVGVMATMTQPKTQELFERDHILRQRVNQKQVLQLNEQLQQYKQQDDSQLQSATQQLKQMLDEFNSPQSTEPLYLIIDGVEYEITNKNFIFFNEDG